MAEIKTKPTNQSVTDYISGIKDKAVRDDCQTLLKLMKDVTKLKPKIWGNGMIGFGSFHYKSASGCEGDWFLTGFAPRKGNLSIHVMAGFEQFRELLAKLGKHKTGKGCLYIKKLDDVDLSVLKELVKRSFIQMQKWPACK